MRGLVVAASLLAAVMSGPVWADTTTAPQPPGDPQSNVTTPPPQPTPPPRPARPRMHCESDYSTGSIMPTRTCVPQEEWEAQQAARQQHQRNTSDRMSSCAQSGFSNC